MNPKPDTSYLIPHIQNKPTAMKSFLLRFVAITFFCLASLMFKSETSACKLADRCISKNEFVPAAKQIINSTTNEQGISHKYEAFFIKI
ncbi:MAG: hypothetical protein ABIO55_03140 [Ginsengibacter sp.]